MKPLRRERLGNYSCHRLAFHTRKGVPSLEIARSCCRIVLFGSRSFRWGVALREKSQNARKPPTHRRGEAIALDIQAALGQQNGRVSGRRDRRFGWRPRRLPEAPRRAAGSHRHGLHYRAAPRSEPRQHDGGFAGAPYVDAGPACDRRNGDRTRTRLCHSARRLSLGRRQRRVAAFEAAGATWRAVAIRLPVEFSCSRIWSARRLRGPFRNRR